MNLSGENYVHTQYFHELQIGEYHQPGYGITVSFNDQLNWSPPIDSTVIQVDFPDIYGKTPFTRVQWQQTNDTISWWTLHVYPEEKMTTHVYTTSYFNRKDFLCL